MPSFDVTRPERLAGSYELLIVGANETARASRDSGRLTLWVQDSVRRTRSGFGQFPPGWGRPLAAAYESEPRDTSSIWWRRRASRDLDRPGGILQRATLRIGDVDVLDGTGNNLVILNADSSGFRGRWRADLGIAVVIDRDGRELPDPAGYFCARRVTSSPR